MKRYNQLTVQSAYGTSLGNDGPNTIGGATEIEVLNLVRQCPSGQ